MQIGKTFKALLLGASVFGLGATGAMAVECVKVIGTEPGLPNITMDPAFVNTSDDSYQLNAVYNRMVNLDSSFQPIPELAKSWSVSDDGLTWTFNLEVGCHLPRRQADDRKGRRVLVPPSARPRGRLAGRKRARLSRPERHYRRR